MSNLLDAVGLSATDSDVYLVLMGGQSMHLDEICDKVELPAATVKASMRVLLDHGLAQQESFVEPVFRAISPDVAIPMLIDRRRRDLTALQGKVDELALSGHVGRSAESPVERVIGEAAVLDMCIRVQGEAEKELLVLDCPPYLAGGVVPNDSQFPALERGVQYRCVYHPDSLVAPDAVDQMRRCVEAGEEARISAEAVPKLMIADGSVALVIASGQAPDAAVRLLVRQSSLLDLLVDHFERVWDSAVPIDAPAETEEVSARDRELLTLLAAGMKDRTIARALGVTERTVGRRVTELMSRLDADTRFRAGVRAAQRGWISGHPNRSEPVI
ncbi:helix-turn-helix transcriptional regulator [Nocardioides speluncae]|uniref:helix-turn-helix transcriptional regulator n=1 Tax=Nocardioides speluncae TaxID=2670337 RepID=UPI000D69750C|nr:LuxR C-terminal-related transcriptional regulator [Nocardioides speluncae]